MTRKISVAVLLFLVSLLGCSKKFPVERGYTLAITPAVKPIHSADPRYPTTLQLRWLGTSFYYIQLGDSAFVIDPFLSHHGALYSLLGGTLTSDPKRVETIIPGPVEPLAALITHAHWDHMLDINSIFKYRNWDDTVVIGSATVGNILNYHSDLRKRWTKPVTGSSWTAIGSERPKTSIRYRAFDAEHSPQFGKINLYSGSVEVPQTTAPKKASDFQKGAAYSYLVSIKSDKITFTIFIMPSASPWPDGLPKGKFPAVDVAILGVPSFDKASGYPGKFVKGINARHIILSHYNNFFDDNYGSPSTLPRTDVYGFLRQIQIASVGTRLEKIHAPDVGSLILLN